MRRLYIKGAENREVPGSFVLGTKAMRPRAAGCAGLALGVQRAVSGPQRPTVQTRLCPWGDGRTAGGLAGGMALPTTL